MYIDKLKKELEQKQYYLEELEELEIPSTQHLHNWLYSLRSNNHGSCTVVNELQHTETNKKLYRQKLVLKWDELVCDGFCIPWQVYHYCDSYLQSTDLDDDIKVYGFADSDEPIETKLNTEKQEYIKEIEEKQEEAEKAMELLDERITYIKDKINFIENEINKIDDF